MAISEKDNNKCNKCKWHNIGMAPGTEDVYGGYGAANGAGATPYGTSATGMYDGSSITTTTTNVRFINNIIPVKIQMLLLV